MSESEYVEDQVEFSAETLAHLVAHPVGRLELVPGVIVEYSYDADGDVLTLNRIGEKDA